LIEHNITMVLIKATILTALVVAVTAIPATQSTFWKSTFLGTPVEEMRAMCNNDDALACIKFKAVTFLDNIFKQDNLQISDDIEITRNSYRSNEIDARSSPSIEDALESYIQTHDVTLKLPIIDSSLTVNARNLQDDEIDVKLNFNSNVGEARKSKLKKIFLPILVFVVLKAITLIPLALGVLGLKAWNALQLSFFSFVVSVSLAIFQLCKKIAADHAQPHIAAHTPWEPAYAARAMDVEQEQAQDLAYSGYRN